ncbi:hypothetical protein RGQ29_016727 [Quercus rubra]|uniref:Uncharacterized protein n=1 Tax=Quercus rubra TaxID=3512 RepID=A0AAN7FK14_QUERU|nr:hypothetical protein RGQ29_016727 [Quercus rubra]
MKIATVIKYALWTWHRNQDVYNEDSHSDQIYIVRQPELCSKTLKPSTLHWERDTSTMNLSDTSKKCQ